MKKQKISWILGAAMVLSGMLYGYGGSGQNIVSAKSNAKLVADSIDDLSYAITSDCVYIQDLVDYCNDELSYESMSTSGSYNVRDYTGTGSDLRVLESYVQTICDGNYNLTLKEEYSKTYSSSTFFCWGINYAGTGDVNATTGVTFTDSECTINIYGTIERDRLEAAVWIPQEMEQVDMGLRYGGKKVSVGIAGPSATAGLYKLSDGSFETTDGRLNAKPGQATVLRDGKAYITEAAFNRDSDLGRDELWVRDFYRDEGLFFCAPKSRLMTGDVYTMKDLIQEASWLNNEKFQSLDGFSAYKWTLFLGVGHDGSFITPLLGEENRFENLTVRVMYWEKDVEAVYYIYADFRTSPYTIEALCAVDLKGGQSIDKKVTSGSASSVSSGTSESSSGHKDQTCYRCGGTGKRTCMVCDGKGYTETTVTVPNYSGSGKGGTKTVRKKCSSAVCSNGEVTCSICGGDGVR